MKDTVRKGAYFALATAVISGFSVYINRFAVQQVADPFVFTTVKNLAVALVLGALLILPRALPEMKALSKRQWLTLALIGCVGGSIPFLLFFYGLSKATAPSAAFIHKTLFIWVALLAVPFLSERLGKLQVAALAVLIVGNLVLLGRPKAWDFGIAEVSILAATLLWAVEAIVARRLLRQVSASVGAFGRMAFGSVVMLAFLAVTGRLDTLAGLSPAQVGWVLATSVLLFGYVTGYYSGLKHAPATMVSSILVLGAVITSGLYAVIDAKRFTAAEVAGLALTALAVAIWLGAAHFTRARARVAEAIRAGR